MMELKKKILNQENEWKKIAIKILRTKFDKISQQNQTTRDEIKYQLETINVNKTIAIKRRRT
jgi:hypothetical protein